MKIDGISLMDDSTADNFSIINGSTLPITGNNLGELFFLTSGTSSNGLHVYDGTNWVKIGNLQEVADNLNLNTHDLTNVGLINGLDIGAHAARHLPNGADPLITATATGLTLSSTNTTGVANSLARSDHTHSITGVQPLSAALTNLAAVVSNGVLRKTATNAYSAGTAIDLVSDITGNLPVTNLANGTNASATTYWTGSGEWTSLSKSTVGLANVDNTTDLNKPISSATQTTLDLKAGLVSPVFTDSIKLTGFTGHIQVPVVIIDPTAPSSGFSKIFVRNVANRPMLRWLDENGLDISVQPHFGFNRIGLISPSRAAILSTINLAVTQLGTFTTPALNALSYKAQIKRFVVPATTTAGTIACVRTTDAECWRGNATGLGGFMYMTRFGLEVLGNSMRAFVGLTDSTSNPTNVNPLITTTNNKIGMAIATNTGNWQFMWNTAGTVPSTTDLGTNFPVNGTDLYELVIYCKANDTKFSYRIKNLTTNTETSGIVDANLPSANAFFALSSWVTNNTSAIPVAMAVSKIYLECDT